MKIFQTSRVTTAVALSLAALTVAKGAWADEDSASFDATIQVLPFCSISTSDLSFGSISAGITPAVDASTSLTVDCSNNTNYSVSLSNGANFDSTRRMSWGGNFVGYSLYSDSTRSLEWTPTQAVTGTGNGSIRTHTIYGRVFSGQSVSNPGTYGDTIVATVSY
ncbi:MAG: hypothetical protein RLZZ344_1564 [Pseudomonadota bacterium]|jgi:spore coat protein U-like protein